MRNYLVRFDESGTAIDAAETVLAARDLMAHIDDGNVLIYTAVVPAYDEDDAKALAGIEWSARSNTGTLPTLPEDDGA